MPASKESVAFAVDERESDERDEDAVGELVAVVGSSISTLGT